jgi:Leucine-rich repeat (LRR) protein
MNKGFIMRNKQITLPTLITFTFAISSLLVVQKSQGLSITDLINKGKLPAANRGGTLDLSAKDITSLEGLNTIQGKDTIHILKLANNKIHAIDAQDFEGFDNLKTLILSENKLTVIPTKAFIYLKQLDKLFLNKNSIENLSTGMLAGMNNLTLLNLSENKIKDVPTGFLQNTPHLKELHLDKNQIRDIDPQIFNKSQLKHVNLMHNSFDKTKRSALRKDFSTRYPHIHFAL